MSDFSRFFLSLLVLLGITACVTNPKPVETRGKLVDAETALASGDYLAAAEGYRLGALASDDPAIIASATELNFDFGRVTAATQLLRHWVRTVPGVPEPELLLGRLAMGDGRSEEALAHFTTFLAIQKSRERDDSAPDPYQVIGNILKSEGEPAERLRLAEALLAKDEANWQAQRLVSDVALASEDVNRAMEAAELAYELEPNGFQAALLQAKSIIIGGDRSAGLEFARQIREQASTPLQNLEYAAFLAGNDEINEATEVVESLLIDQPEHTAAKKALAFLRMRGGDNQSAWVLFSELSKLAAEQHEALYYLASIAEREGRAEQAIRLFKQVGPGPNQALAEQRVSQLLLRAGDVEAAVRNLEEFSVANPEPAFRLLLPRVALYKELGRYPQALALYDTALSLQPDSEPLLLSRAELLLESDDLDAAIVAYRKVLATHPDSAVALNALGYTLADRTTKYKEARGLLARALTLAPDNPAIIDSMGWVEFKLGNYQAALGHLERAWKLMKDPEVAAHLGETLWRLGEKERARQILKEAFDAAPDSEPLRRTLERLLEEEATSTQS